MENIILQLLEEKNIIDKRIESLIYGTVEIREGQSGKYIYVHYRQDGISYTKYVGLYSDDLYNLIVKNSVEVKQLKKQLKKINKELEKYGFSNDSISSEVKTNIDFAKKNLVSTIYKQAVLEGIATTYADTETIIEGGKANNLTTDEVLKVVNLKRAWEFVLNQNVIITETNFNLLCQINKIVEDGFYYNAGKLRTTPVGIGGTTWIPDFPIESVIKEQLQDILNSEKQIVDKAIDILLYVMKKQIFIDGNKRTAVIFANHLLVKNGLGIIVIPDEKVEEYKKLLIDYYEGKDQIKIKNFLKQYAYKSIKNDNI